MTVLMNYARMFSLEGRTALIAGASRGIGLATARAMAHQGAHTVLAARSSAALRSEAADLRGAGLSARSIRLDVTDEGSIEAAAEACPDADILVNVAGTNIRRRFEDYTREEYELIMQTNLHGIAQLTRIVGGRMAEGGRGGKVINIGSLMSVLGLPYVSIYAMTKSALAGLTRVLAAEWAHADVQVNCIAPGFILTDLNRDMWEPSRMTDWLHKVQANPRLGTPNDIAGLAAFLASSAADYITGQVIAADGGYTTTAKWPFEPLT
ncbi:MAG: SDR family oxidoreductase [Bryobacterales bacterium]|nr:SDR family oxidoreductase [Bryobacterales bacterium]MDE0628688.1 SDR family oxidoreductase [Bryobacterales bacterium]